MAVRQAPTWTNTDDDRRLEVEADESAETSSIRRSTNHTFAGSQIVVSRPAQLADAATLSAQAIKDLEARRGDLLRLVTVAMALGFAHKIWRSCQPQPTTLDELDRIELPIRTSRAIAESAEK